MGENHCPPNFLTNQQTGNNISTPISQQPVADNDQNLGFRQFCYDQEQRRIRVEQKISSHYEECRKKRVNDGSNSALSLPFFPSQGYDGNNGNDERVLGKGDADVEEEEALLMRRSEQHVSPNIKLITVPPAHSLHNQEDSQIKRPPIWRPRFAKDKGIKEKLFEHNQSKRFECSKEAVVIDENCRPTVENELGYGGSALNKTNQMCDCSVHGSKLFRGDEREDVPREFKNGKEGDKMRYLNPEIESMADLFTSSVNQLMDHQERFHQRFLETIKRLDGKRREREEAWRQQELARLDQEAITRWREHTMASTRDATIISYLEKIIGQNTLPPRKMRKVAESLGMKKHPRKTHEVAKSTEMKKLASGKTHEVDVSAAMKKNMINRWPNSEVDALIRIRVSHEPKFRDPKQKGALWEEISDLMASMGYNKNAQRCREKWENINRYYKSAKENSKVQSPQKHNNCPYFQQLDQFYASKSLAIGLSSSSSCTKFQGRNLLPIANVEGIQEEEEEEEEEEEGEEEEESDD